jgi:indolepyruvate decarboxylase
MPSRESMRRREPLHHTFLDGDLTRFARMYQEVTAAQAVLEPETAHLEIDRVLTAALDVSKPVYIGVPLDVSTAKVPAAGLASPLTHSPSDRVAVEAFARALRDRLSTADHAIVLAGPRVHRRGLESAVRELAALPGVSVAAQSGSKALLDEQHPASLGTYLGATTASPRTRKLVDAADPLILVGAVFSDFTTGFFTHGYTPADAIDIGINQARVGRAVFPDVGMADALGVLHREVAAAGLTPLNHPRCEVSEDVPSAADADRLDHDVFWAEIQKWLTPETTVVAEAGTSFYGTLDLDLPERSDLLGQPIWSSIGYTIPATLGASLARADRRPVLFIGDGSAQLTAQELGHVFAHGNSAVVFLLNNDGYTVERAIQSPDAVYQNIVRWNWPHLPSALGAPEVTAATATTIGELRAALAHSAEHSDGPHFIEVVLPRLDAPRLLVELARGITGTNATSEAA